MGAVALYSREMPLDPRRLLREPLLHFVLLGVGLFALDHARRGSTAGPQSARITLGADVRASLVEGWTSAHGHPPTRAESDELIGRWIDEELLYREGLARGLERDDPRVRERIATKMGLVLRSQIIVPEPTDAELRAWFEAHAERWARAELLDFTQVFVEGDDEPARARARELLAQLSAGADPNGLGDPFSGGRRYRRRKIEDLASAFGDEFVAHLSEQAEATWVQRRSRSGLHLVRVDRRTSAQGPDFASVEAEVRDEWSTARRAQGVAEAMQKLRARWEIVTEP
jgi:peptidyl-prolyl cis-trans isomerase C